MVGICSVIRKVCTVLGYPARKIMEYLGRGYVMYRMDGGTCSQLHGLYIISNLEKEGYNVIVDMSFYDSKVRNQVYNPCARPYTLDRLFEYKQFKVAGKFRKLFYEYFYSYEVPEREKENGVSVCLSEYKLPKGPLYMRDYYSYRFEDFYYDWKSVCTMRRAEEVLDDENMKVYSEIKSYSNTIAVHVRRGDMAETAAYWTALSSEYFKGICNNFLFKDFKFFFFSEEPEWIKKEVVPYIDVDYLIVDLNSSYYGYRDLLLMSKCKYQVKSQGSFGLYAYMLNENEGKKLIVPDADNISWKYYILSE